MNTAIDPAARRTLAAIRSGDRADATTAAVALSDAIEAFRGSEPDAYLSVLEQFAHRAALWGQFGYDRDENGLRTAIDAVVLVGEIEALLSADDDSGE